MARRVTKQRLKVLEALRSLEGTQPSEQEIADCAEVSRRTVQRALAHLVADGRVLKEGKQRQRQTYTLVEVPEVDADEPEAEPTPSAGEEGEERYYTPLRGPEHVVWRERMVLAYRTGRGMAHWREAGEFLLCGGNASSLSSRAREAVAQARGLPADSL